MSTQSLLVVKELNELLNRSQKALNYFERTGQKPRAFIKQTKPEHISHPQPTKTFPTKMSFQVTAYSHCPDYESIFQNAYGPFALKYPDIAKYVNYTYVSMAKVEPMNAAKASSLHGQYEAHMDLIYLCIQDMANDQFVAS